MTDCSFIINADGLWQCWDCGWIYKRKSDKPPKRNCPKKLTPEQLEERKRKACEEAEALRPEGEKLGWDFGMVCRYAAALKKWVAAGRPTRTDEEVEAIKAICKSDECKKYEPIEGRCRACGCKIHTPGITILSKAKLATETCPKDKW